MHRFRARRGTGLSLWRLNAFNRSRACGRRCCCCVSIYVLCTNHEVVVFQPRIGTALDLGSVANYTFYSNPPAPPFSTGLLGIFISHLYPTAPPSVVFVVVALSLSTALHLLSHRKSPYTCTSPAPATRQTPQLVSAPRVPVSAVVSRDCAPPPWQDILNEIFVDLHKAYDALDQGHALEILEGYGMFPQVLRLLIQYWYQATMAERVSGYYMEPFQGYCGVTQGGTLSPRTLNVVVYAIICH